MGTGSTRSWTWLAVAVAVAGCTWPNPAFNESQSNAAGGGSASGATEGATGGATTIPTSGDGGTGGSGEATSGVTAATSGGVGSSGVEMSSGTGDTGEPGDCWGLGDAWMVQPLEFEPNSYSPSLSGDGLAIYYKTGAVMTPALYRAARPSVNDAFPNGGALFFTADGLNAVEYPEVRANETELFFTQTDSNVNVYVVRGGPGAWGAATIAGGFMLFGNDDESHPEVTEDGTYLLFQRNDGPPVGALAKTWRFYQASRVDTMAPFPDVAPVEVTPTAMDMFHPVCPVLSPDGLHLLFSAGDAVAMMSQLELNDGRVGVWEARRNSVTDNVWTDVSRSTVLRLPGVATCATSVTADGCQIAFERFTVGGAPPQYSMGLARRK